MNEPAGHEDEFEPFVEHTLVGPRFSGHAVPVAVLPELTAYREILLDVARALFFREHPDRKRVPKGFDDGLDLVLRTIEDGSAVAPLERRRRQSTPRQLALAVDGVEDAGTDFHRLARDLTSELIASVRDGKGVPPAFPPTSLRLFNNFGRSLRADEHIAISRGPGTPTTTYDPAVRKRVVLSREATYEDRVEITGPVVQFDRERETFGVSDQGRTVVGSLKGLSEEQFRVIRQAAVHIDALQVRIVGTGAFDLNDRLVRLLGATDVDFAEDEDLREALSIEKRLAAIATLADGWLDGGGAAVSREGLAWLTQALTAAEGDGLPRPYLYPTPDGNVQAEWTFPDAEVSAFVDLSVRTASCVGVHIKSGAHLDGDFSLEVAEGTSLLAGFVARFAP
ncbi:MAG: hypothetical protein H6726_23995 [Sandaracinaceae bacterium]|nr:hypothetical protein [Sandaracinaceae bacterium]